MNDMSNNPVTPQAPVADAADNLLALAKSIHDRKHHIEEALSFASGTHNLDDIVYMILQDKLLWWPLDNGFMVTEIVTYPRQRHLNVFLAGGDLDEIRAMQEPLVTAAKALGCCALTLGGRKGWVKALKQLGWKDGPTSAYFAIEQEQDNG